MLKDLLKEVIVIVAGKPSEPIATLLHSNKHVNEFTIAKKLDLTINQTRNILYKISDHGLVSSIRKKDKRKGWYTYFWKIEVEKSLEFLKNALLKNINQLENQIKSGETKIFYACETCKVEYNEENALLHNFTCNECGKIFVQVNNVKIIRELKRNLDKLQKELKITNEELQLEVNKKAKKVSVETRKQEKEKKALRKLNAQKRAKLRAEKKKSSIKTNKKPLKKKEVKKKSMKKKPVKKKVTKRVIKKKVAKKKPVKKKSKKVVKRKPVKKKVVKKKSAKKKIIKKKQTNKKIISKIKDVKNKFNLKNKLKKK